MARSPFEFLRGTPALFLADLQDPGMWPTQYGTIDSTGVLCIGDAHPENLGAFRVSDDELSIQFNDFDGAHFGPYHFDLRRLAFSWAIVAQVLLQDSHRQNRPLASLEQKDVRTNVEKIVNRVVAGYVEEINRYHDDDAERFTPTLKSPKLPKIFAELLKKAKERGPTTRQLDSFTEKDENSERHFLTGELRRVDDGIPSRELWTLTPEEKQSVEAAVELWRSSVPNREDKPETQYEIADIRRRIGAGVGSYPLLRYYVLLKGPETDAKRDYVIIDLKENGLAPYIAEKNAIPLSLFTSFGQRVVTYQRLFLQPYEPDPLLGYADLKNGLSFRVQSRTDYQRGLDLSDMVDSYTSKDITYGDLLDAAEFSGKLLAAGHANAKTRYNQLGANVIYKALTGSDGELDVEGFKTETLQFVMEYLQLFSQDYQNYQRLLNERGALLGYAP